MNIIVNAFNYTCCIPVDRCLHASSKINVTCQQDAIKHMDSGCTVQYKVRLADSKQITTIMAKQFEEKLTEPFATAAFSVLI